MEAITKRDGAAAKNKNTIPHLVRLILSLGRKSLELFSFSRNETPPMNFSGSSNAQFISLFPVFVNQESAEQVIRKYYWKNDAHWNEEGHRLVAEALLQPEGGIELPCRPKRQ